MIKKNNAGRKPCYKGKYNFNALENTVHSPEVCSLNSMNDMIGDYRKEILEKCRVLKKLRDQASMQELASLHLKQRINHIDTLTREGIENWRVLRLDYFIQRQYVMGQDEQSVDTQE